MYAIVNIKTDGILKDNEGNVYTFQHQDNADEVAQDLSHAESDSEVIYMARPFTA